MTTISTTVDMDESPYNSYSYFAVNPNSSITITTPSIYTDGTYLKLFRMDANLLRVVTIQAREGQTIGGGNSKVLPIGQCMELVSQGTNWIAPTYAYTTGP